MKRLLKLLLCFFLFYGGRLYSQVPSVIQHIRIPLWAELDAYPELLEPQDLESAQYDFPISRIRELGPFLVSGMVYGWEFSYFPSDKARNVEESFELTSLMASDLEIYNITYSDPWVQDDRLNCWCEYSRTTEQVRNYNLWNSIQNPSIQGIGYGKIKDGFDGIKTACEDAVKNAVRNHYRSKIKNKPKEITGRILIKSEPLLGIDSGQYVMKLDFFLEYGKIIEYLMY